MWEGAEGAGGYPFLILNIWLYGLQRFHADLLGMAKKKTSVQFNFIP
jgi:hypothetical protein